MGIVEEIINEHIDDPAWVAGNGDILLMLEQEADGHLTCDNRYHLPTELNFYRWRSEWIS